MGSPYGARIVEMYEDIPLLFPFPTGTDAAR